MKKKLRAFDYFLIFAIFTLITAFFKDQLFSKMGPDESLYLQIANRIRNEFAFLPANEYGFNIGRIYPLGLPLLTVLLSLLIPIKVAFYLICFVCLFILPFMSYQISQYFNLGRLGISMAYYSILAYFVGYFHATLTENLLFPFVLWSFLYFIKILQKTLTDNNQNINDDAINWLYLSIICSLLIWIRPPGIVFFPAYISAFLIMKPSHIKSFFFSKFIILAIVIWAFSSYGMILYNQILTKRGFFPNDVLLHTYVRMLNGDHILWNQLMENVRSIQPHFLKLPDSMHSIWNIINHNPQAYSRMISLSWTHLISSSQFKTFIGHIFIFVLFAIKYRNSYKSKLYHWTRLKSFRLLHSLNFFTIGLFILNNILLFWAGLHRDNIGRYNDPWEIISKIVLSLFILNFIRIKLVKKSIKYKNYFALGFLAFTIIASSQTITYHYKKRSGMPSLDSRMESFLKSRLPKNVIISTLDSHFTAARSNQQEMGLHGFGQYEFCRSLLNHSFYFLLKKDLVNIQAEKQNFFSQTNENIELLFETEFYLFFKSKVPLDKIKEYCQNFFEK